MKTEAASVPPINWKDLRMATMTDTATERDRTRRQQLCALEAANEIRLDRARLRHEISALPMEEGCVRLAEVLTVMPRSIRSTPIGNVLRWPRFMYAGRVAQWLAAAQCSGTRKIGLLSERQRMRLAELLREHGTGGPVSGLTDLDRSILDCLDMAADGALTMSREIASDTGVPGRTFGSRLASLKRRGYIVGVAVGSSHLQGWRTSEAWRAGVLPR